MISAGLEHQFGHPHPEVVDRLAAAGSAVVRTDRSEDDDTVVLTSDCQSFSFSTGERGVGK